ncbi:hypothetical protein BH09PSE2_BH09PSE2_21610 [soil metagenome]
MSLPEPDLAGRVQAVARGPDGRLFLEQGDAFDAREMFGQPCPGDDGLERLWRPALERRARLCAEVGAVFVVMIAPEAHGVHADTSPLPYARPSIGDRFAALCRSLGILTVWPRDALIAARGPVELYRRDDSHWTAFGAFLAYRELMAALPPHLRTGEIKPAATEFSWDEAMGDLGCTQPAAERSALLVSQVAGVEVRVLSDRRNERRHALRISEADTSGTPRCLMFRDSFGGELAPFLCASFQRTTLVGAGSCGHLDLITDSRPDVVILQRGERTLRCGVLDWDQETWREAFPDPGPDRAAHERELLARALLDAGDAQSALEALDSAPPTVERLILSGRAELACGRAAQAVSALEAAVAIAPGRWTAVLHLGIARLTAADPQGARDAFARACALQPFHPAGFEHFGFASLALGYAAGAAAALRTAVRLAPQSPGAHLWLGEALTALGEPEAAREAFATGRRTCPDDPLLAARAG